MTPEEMAALEQYVQLMQRSQGDPLALSANAYGQGPGFLGASSTPDSWDRRDDKYDIYRDLFSMTGTDMSEFVPGLYDYVPQPKPEDMQGYQSDTTSLFANNPVYQEIERQVANGVDIVTATNAVRTAYENDPESLQGSLPMGNPEYGQAEPDWEAVTQNATTYLSERNKEVGGQSEADTLRAQYEDFVRPRSQWEMAGAPTYQDVRGKYAQQYGWDDPKLGFEELNPGTVQATAPTVQMDLSQAKQATDRFDNEVSSPTRNPLAGAKRQQRGDQARANAEAVRNSPNRPMVGYIQGKGENLGVGSGVVQRDDTEARFKKYFDSGIKEAKSKQMASKKEENLARLTAFYNTLMYGQ